MSVQRWSRRPAEIEAVQLTDGNVADVAAFAGGRADRDHLGRPVVHLPSTTIPVTVTDWAVRDVMPDGLSGARAVKDHLMRWAYTPDGGLRQRRKDSDEPPG